MHHSGLCYYSDIKFPAVIRCLEERQEPQFSVVRASTAPFLLSTCDKVCGSATFWLWWLHDNVAK